MATVNILPANQLTSSASGSPTPVGVLATGQTGTGVSTNIADRGGQRGPAVLEITSTVGATPTATVAIEGSMDGGDWYAVAHGADPLATPVLTALTITTATLTRRFLPTDHAWRFLRLNITANTNVTLSAEILI